MLRLWLGAKIYENDFVQMLCFDCAAGISPKMWTRSSITVMGSPRSSLYRGVVVDPRFMVPYSRRVGRALDGYNIERSGVTTWESQGPMPKWGLHDLNKKTLSRT